MRWYDVRARLDLRGVRMCRKQALDDAELVTLLPIASARKESLRSKIRHASLRKHLALNYLDNAIGQLAGVWVVLCVAGYALFAQHGIQPETGQRNPPNLNALISITLALIAANFSAPTIRILVNSKVLAKRASFAIAAALALIWIVGGIGQTVTEMRVPHEKKEVYLLVAWLCLALWPVAAIGKNAASAKRAKTICHAYDTFALTMLEFISSMLKQKGRWHRDSIARQWISGLDGLAENASYALSFPNRTVSGDREAGTRLRTDSRRIAAVFRSHKMDVTRARNLADIEAVIESLICGLEAILDRDIDRLLAQAPESSADPYATIGRRLAPGITLITLGTTLPLIPIIAEVPQAAGYLRWTLVVAGAVMIASSNAEVAARVNEAMGKSMTMKS